MTVSACIDFVAGFQLSPSLERGRMSADEKPAARGMTHKLSALLDQVNLTPQEKNQLTEKLGVTEINDIRLLKDADLMTHQLGIRLVPWRKLLQAAQAAGQAAAPGGDDDDGPGGCALPRRGQQMQVIKADRVIVEMMTKTADAGSARLSRSAAAQEAIELVIATERAKVTALDALNRAKLAAYQNDLAVNGLKYAMQKLENPECTAAMAGQAVVSASRSRRSCPRELRPWVDEALRCARDYLVLKVQIHAALGDRDQFIAELHAALGDAAAQQLDTNGLSLYLMVHSKVVGGPFPQAFLSNAQVEAGKRPGKRPARRTTRPARATQNSPESGQPSEVMTSGARWLDDSVRPPPGLELEGLAPRNQPSAMP